jgi:hypothetical protein
MASPLHPLSEYFPLASFKKAMLLIGLNRKGKTPLKKLILHGRGMKEPASQAGLTLWTNARIILFLV